MTYATRNLLALLACITTTLPVAASEFDRPWLDDTAIIIDPYHGNALDFDALQKDERVAAIIHKASQGLRKDRKYEARRIEALKRGYLWGSYHLLTNADPVQQIDHYLKPTGNYDAEVYAIDVECFEQSGSCQFNSLKVTPQSVETALRHFKSRMGFYPLLYLNDTNRKILERRWSGLEEFSGIPLWYARFRNDISSFFPGEVWPTYTLWQFSSEINCGPQKPNCPYRIEGIPSDMDINLFSGNVEALKSAWPLRIN